MSLIGRNINTIDDVTTTTVTINSVTATELLPANSKRIYAIVNLSSGSADIEAFVRKYDATTDNIKQGRLLVRATSGNNNLYRPVWKTEIDNPYTGPVSAISVLGSFDLHVEEGQ